MHGHSTGPVARAANQWSEILRLACSIRLGTVTSSLILRKLASYPRQNGLALALREFGRIVRGTSRGGACSGGSGLRHRDASVIKAVIGGIAQRYAGLAAGIVISTFQIGAALGVAVIGGVFFSTLGAGQDLAAYAHAFAIALGCNVALLVLGGVLSLWLPGEKRPTAS